MIELIDFHLNHKPTQLRVESSRRLLWVLRTDLNLTGTKCGCEAGLCGACTVLIDDQAARSCQVPVGEIKNKQVVTIEGLARNGQLHPLQESFIEHDALQCGFCTPGMILQAYSLLQSNPHPTEKEIRQGMKDNLCRCGPHQRIVAAIAGAARGMKGEKR